MIFKLSLDKFESVVSNNIYLVAINLFPFDFQFSRRLGCINAKSFIDEFHIHKIDFVFNLAHLCTSHSYSGEQIKTKNCRLNVVERIAIFIRLHTVDNATNDKQQFGFNANIFPLYTSILKKEKSDSDPKIAIIIAKKAFFSLSIIVDE